MEEENFVLFGEEGAQERSQLTYGSYLRLAQLLDAQHFESQPPAHDELLFITIHQSTSCGSSSCSTRSSRSGTRCSRPPRGSTVPT